MICYIYIHDSKYIVCEWLGRLISVLWLQENAYWLHTAMVQCNDITLTAQCDDITVTTQCDDITVTTQCDDITVTVQSDDITATAQCDMMVMPWAGHVMCHVTCHEPIMWLISPLHVGQEWSISCMNRSQSEQKRDWQSSHVNAGQLFSGVIQPEQLLKIDTEPLSGTAKRPTWSCDPAKASGIAPCLSSL